MSVYSLDSWHKDVDVLIQAIAWALRMTVPFNIPYSLGNLAFGMDMIMRLYIKINWTMLKEQRHRMGVANNAKENKGRLLHQYNVGDLVLIVEKPYERAKKSKLSSPTEGPCNVLRVYTNGNVRIRWGNFHEDISIRHLRPYHKRD